MDLRSRVRKVAPPMTSLVEDRAVRVSCCWLRLALRGGSQGGPRPKGRRLMRPTGWISLGSIVSRVDRQHSDHRSCRSARTCEDRFCSVTGSNPQNKMKTAQGPLAPGPPSHAPDRIRTCDLMLRRQLGLVV